MDVILHSGLFQGEFKAIVVDLSSFNSRVSIVRVNSRRIHELHDELVMKLSLNIGIIQESTTMQPRIFQFENLGPKFFSPKSLVLTS